MAQHLRLDKWQTKGHKLPQYLWKVLNEIHDCLMMTNYSHFMEDERIVPSPSLSVYILKRLPKEYAGEGYEDEFEGWQAWMVEPENLPKRVKEHFGNIEIHYNPKNSEYFFFSVM